MMRVFFILLMFFASDCFAQKWNITEMSPMPMRISNNAVCEGKVGSIPYVYSFGGIDSTKIYSGIKRSSFRYNTVTNLWEQIADLPDTSGKIASSASNVKNKIYIIGGYHVSSSGSETSSNKVHVYDPQSNSFLPDAANIPVAIDDQVQCVWRDSLIYVITGWSNTTNVPNVQIFNPALNTWSAGTSVPNNTTYKVFGGCGIIIGDTIYYYGGAATGFNFPAQNKLRIGIIDSLNPANITWSQPWQEYNCYRCAATNDSLNNIHIIGGSTVSYNYDGIAYNGSGGVNPNNTYASFHPNDVTEWNSRTDTLPMDLRGIANISSSVKYLAGGMEYNQSVSNKTLKLEFVSTVNVEEQEHLHIDILIFPNPNNGEFRVIAESMIKEIIITDMIGREIQRLVPDQQSFSYHFQESGFYILIIRTERGISSKRILVEKH